MTGIISLYAAVLIVGASFNKSGKEGFHTYQDIWAWIAHLLNLPNFQFIYGDILLAFLKLTAYFLHQHYKNHFDKVLKAIEVEFIPKITDEASNTRLKLFLNECKVWSNIREPAGYNIIDEPEPDYDTDDD